MQIDHSYDGQSPSVDALIIGLTARQQGVVARRQLDERGVGRGAVELRLRKGLLLPIHRGVYAMAGLPLTIRGHWMAAVLACGPEAVLSHFAAAALWDLQRAPSVRIDVTAPGKHALKGVRCHIARSLPDQDRATIDGIPVTSLNRTVLDLSELQSRQRVRSTLEAVQRRDLLDKPALDALIDRTPGRNLHHLRAALNEIHDEAPWTQSELETRFLEVIRAAGLPEPSVNVVVHDEVVDFYWPGAQLIVEVDGYAFHKGRRAFEQDRARDLKLRVAGEHVIRITHRVIEHETIGLVADLRRLLGSTAA
jgi:very-short-patch-repair endonuclease